MRAVFAKQYDEGRKTIIRSNPLATDDEIAAQKLVSKHAAYGALCFGRARPKLMTKNRLQAEQHLVACGEDVRRQLRDLLDQFLAGPYNKLMGQVVSDISNERHRGLSTNEALLRCERWRLCRSPLYCMQGTRGGGYASPLAESGNQSGGVDRQGCAATARLLWSWRRCASSLIRAK